MTKYRVSLFTMVPAFCDIDVEANTPEEAQKLALEKDAAEWKAGASHRMDYDVEWGEHETPEVNEVRLAPTRRARA
jgi:hypothetical protein